MQSSHNIKRVREVLDPPVPDICQSWDTIELFSPVKVHQKVRKFAIRVICAKQSTDLKKYTTIGCCGCDKYQLWVANR